MALSKRNVADIPKDAQIITEDQALQYQWKIIKSWENPSDVWALRHTVTTGAAMASLTGIYVNSHYRRKLRLGRYGHMSTYLPIVVIPAIFSTLAHKFLVQKDVILDPMGQCPVCLQVRAAALQTACGVAYPTILAPFAAFMYATRHFTYRLPSITEKPKEVFELWRKISRPIVPTLGAIFMGQALITMYLTYKQIDQNLKIMSKMQKIEQQIEEEVAEARQMQNIF